jgi:hypothetical protein
MDKRIVAVALAGLLLGACATIPAGPSVLALPGSSRNFDQFRLDEADCRQYAYQQIGGVTAEQAQIDSGVRSAAVGTVVGAAAGAAIGGGEGAAIGAGTGLLFGSLAGSQAAWGSAWGAQNRYDNAYLQCMYAKGHRVPVSGRYSADAPRQRYYPPPPPPSDLR